MQGVLQSRDGDEQPKWRFVLVRFTAGQAFGSSKPHFSRPAPTQRQHPEEAGQGSPGAGSQWASSGRGGAWKHLFSRETKPQESTVRAHLYAIMFQSNAILFQSKTSLTVVVLEEVATLVCASISGINKKKSKIRKSLWHFNDDDDDDLCFVVS